MTLFLFSRFFLRYIANLTLWLCYLVETPHGAYPVKSVVLEQSTMVLVQYIQLRILGLCIRGSCLLVTLASLVSSYLCGSFPSVDTWAGGSIGSGCAACATSHSSCRGCSGTRACCRCCAWRSPCSPRRRWCHSAGLWRGLHRWGKHVGQLQHLTEETEWLVRTGDRKPTDACHISQHSSNINDKLDIIKTNIYGENAAWSKLLSDLKRNPSP